MSFTNGPLSKWTGPLGQHCPMLTTAIIGGVVAGGVAAAGSAAGGALAASGIPDPSLSLSEQRAIAGQFAQQRLAIEQASLANQLALEQLVSAESAHIGIFADIGEIGTYEQPFEAYRADNPLPGGKHKTGGLFQNKTLTSSFSSKELPFGHTLKSGEGEDGGGHKTFTAEATAPILNAGKLQDTIRDSRQFRMVSYLTAEADQLVRQEGPLWDQLQRSVHGPIVEGAGMLHQEVMEQLSREAGRSGSARARAVQTTQRIRAAEDIARDKQQNMWQANLALIQYGRDRATQQLAFNQQWSANLPGIRTAFNALFASVQQFYGNTILPAQIAVANAGIDSIFQQRSLLAQRTSTEQIMGQMIAGASQVIGGSILSATSGPQAAPTQNILVGQQQQNLNSILSRGGSIPISQPIPTGLGSATRGVAS